MSITIVNYYDICNHLFGYLWFTGLNRWVSSDTFWYSLLMLTNLNERMGETFCLNDVRLSLSL